MKKYTLVVTYKQNVDQVVGEFDQFGSEANPSKR